jgi:hypothetical protein
MRNGYGQLNVAHALTPDPGKGDLDTATITHNATMFDTLVLTAGALPVFDWTKDALTKKDHLFQV